MKKLLFIFAMAVGIAFNSSAQSVTISKQNQDAIDNYNGVGGHFNYQLNERERVNVNYALTPKHPTSIAHFMLHTPDPMPFWATVSDASGKVVTTWKPEEKVYLYNADWNIAALSTGVYTVKIYLETEAKSIYQFDFTKQ